jgi:sulfide:quinone oxidoreductase
MSTVVILGGGTGGVVCANVLGKTLGKGHRVVLVDRKDSHVFMGSYPLLMINKRKAEDITRKLENLAKKGVEFIHSEVKKVLTEQSAVQTDSGYIEYDYLIISLGAEHHPETVPGFAEGAYNIYNFDDVIRLGSHLKTIRGGKIVLFISSLPIICPSAPYEIVFLLDEYFRERGIRDKVELSLVTPEQSPFPLAGPRVGASFRRMLQERRIGLTTNARVLTLDPSSKTLALDQGINVQADLFLGIPSHWGPTVMRSTGLVEEGGWLEVDPYTLETKRKNVFAIGDATGLRLPVMNVFAPKAGIFAHYQAEVVSRNIALLIKGEKARFRYTAKGLCIMNTGFGRARYSTVRYFTKPKPFITLLRPARWAYWAKLAFEKYWLTRFF